MESTCCRQKRMNLVEMVSTNNFQSDKKLFKGPVRQGIGYNKELRGMVTVSHPELLYILAQDG